MLAPTARSAGGQCVLGAMQIVFALRRSVRYVVRVGGKGTGDPSPTARSAGGQCALGAEVVVISLTRSIRYVCADRGRRDREPVPYEIDWHNGTLPSGEGGNDTQRTKHENVAGHAGGTGNPSPTRVFDIAPMYRKNS